jgi:hypothetical protein
MNDSHDTPSRPDMPTPSPSPEWRGDPCDDPEIAALLDFEPVPRKVVVPGGWTPDAQREFIARLAVHGSAGKACNEMDRHRTGVTKLYYSPNGASFRAAWDAAVELATRRRAERMPLANFVSPGVKPPTLDNRRKSPPLRGHSTDPHGSAEPLSPLRPDPLPLAGEGGGPAGPGGEGQVLNEYGEWEDEGSLQRRADEARDSVSRKLLKARRLYLQEISGSPGKRAAFEILTQLPIDWEKAAALEPQPDEPWRNPSMRKPDMLLTAENGWLGDVAHGPDKKAELMRAIDEYRAEEGLDPVEWGGHE